MEVNKQTTPAGPPEIGERVWQIWAAVILAAGAAFRLVELGLKPVHHDEGVNGVFLARLVHEGYYHYDPANYHGPTLYYLAALIAKVNSIFGGDGLSNVSIRVLTAIFGIALVALVLWMWRLLGKREALVAAAVIAISPGAVFYSRYFIHEILFVFFTLALAVCAWMARERSDPGYLPMGALAAAFLFTTKETALVSVVVLVLAFITQRIWVRVRGQAGSLSHTGWPRGRGYVALGAGVFVALFVVLYSSFFTNFPKGILDALQSLTIWTKTGFSMEFFPKYVYVTWIARQESPFLAVAVVGTAAAVWKKPASFAAFAGIWAMGMFAVYSLIPYKEPWLALNFTIPAAIAGGYGAVRLWERGPRFLWALAGCGVAGLLVYQSVELNFVHYDEEAQPYVYMQTTREVNDLMRDIEATAARTRAGKKMSIAIVAPEYWPLPWYLRDYKDAGYWGRIVATQATAVIGSKDQSADLAGRLGPGYRFVQYYHLRPGVILALFVRR